MALGHQADDQTACTIYVAKHFSQHRGSYACIGQDIDMAWNFLTLKSPFPLGGVVAVVVAAVVMESSKAAVIMGLSKPLSLVSVDIGEILPPSRTAAGC